MKIVLLGFSKLVYMPYAFFYMECLLNGENDVHLVSWNRDGEQDIAPLDGVTVHEFNCFQQNQVEKKSKLANFFRYRRYALAVLKNIKPDRVVCLHTLPGIVLFDQIVTKYRNHYIYDYRDYTYEDNYIFRKLVAKIVKSSMFTFVSSDCFRKYLPIKYKEKIFTSHNITEDLINQETSFHKNDHEPIRIGFWGIVRNESLNRLIIERLANNEKIELHFFGKEENVVKNLKNYCSDVIKAKNVFFHGSYRPADRFVFSKEIDIIHNIYNDKNMLMAVSNKLYDGVFLEIPQVCITGSYMGDIVTEYKIGVALNPNDTDFAERILEYYNNLESQSFSNACKQAQKEIIRQYKQAGSIVRNI